LILTTRELIVCAGQTHRIIDLAKVKRVALWDEIRYGERFRYILEFTYGEERMKIAVGLPAFRSAVLDRYMEHDPYPGEPVCWYCGKAQGILSEDVNCGGHRVVGGYP
jgi:hypothetical protein